MHDLTELWARFRREFVPQRERVKQAIDDPDALAQHLNEHLPAAEGQVLEALIADPSSVIIQPFVPHEDEVRVHAVAGRVLEGATCGRWYGLGPWTRDQDIAAAEAAVRRMFANGPPISCGADVLIHRSAEGVKCTIVDLNAGLESGMYLPENDIYVTNALAAHFLGRRTPYLRDLDLFDRAPLAEKLGHARRMNAIVGAFARENEAYGFYDKLVSGYMREVRRRPRREIFREALRQLESIEGIGDYERECFVEESLRSGMRPTS